MKCSGLTVCWFCEPKRFITSRRSLNSPLQSLPVSVTDPHFSRKQQEVGDLSASSRISQDNDILRKPADVTSMRPYKDVKLWPFAQQTPTTLHKAH